ncbi:radial spoke head 14 homolog [Amphiura filiformis]|uniref:radial spoke head 14 homolog n=1 Tax=Amphiura filiformis TaxID=82378 RepID=UPI003B213B8B
MATTRISARLPPNIDPTKAPLAYGDRALPKLNRELQDEELITRQRALMTLCDYLHDPEHIAEALRVGVAESLKALLTDPDGTVRQKATEVLYIIAGHNIGRDAFLDYTIILPLSRLFDDKIDIVRLNAHMAIEMLCEFYPGAEGVVEASLVPTLVDKLRSDLDQIKEYILDTLHFCMRLEQIQALIAGAMEAFTELLVHDSPIIRAKAARDIMDLSVPLSGKNKACEVKSLPPLVQLLDDDDTDVRAKAAGAIMTITITTEGKYKAIEAQAIPRLVKLVNDDNSEVRLNAIKAITMLSEAPEGRNALLNHVEMIKKRMGDDSAAVINATEIAVKTITWKP